MGIGSLAEYGGLYHQYRLQEIPSVGIDTVKKQDAEAEKIRQAESQGTPDNSSPAVIEQKPDLRSRSVNLEDVSLIFNKESSFDYIGNESEINNLDMQKAVSDMRKDNIFQQYQYFVGSSQAFMQQSATEDGVVLRKLTGLE